MRRIKQVRDAIGDGGIETAVGVMLDLAQTASDERVKFDAAQSLIGYFIYYDEPPLTEEVTDDEPSPWPRVDENAEAAS